jgi:RNA polymerase sigma-70 factor, ECF subfamily
MVAWVVRMLRVAWIVRRGCRKSRRPGPRAAARGAVSRDCCPLRDRYDIFLRMADVADEAAIGSTNAAGAWNDQAPRVRRYLRFLGADRDALDDLAQEALLAAFRTFGSQGAPLPWLLTTARNAFAMHLRRSSRSRELADLERLDQAWQQQAGGDGGDAQLEALAACLRSLPARTRSVLMQRYRDGASRAAIAAATGLGEQGVKSLLARARTLLADCIRRRTGND